MKDLPQDLIQAFERNVNNVKFKQLINWNDDGAFNEDEIIENEILGASISKKY